MEKKNDNWYQSQCNYYHALLVCAKYEKKNRYFFPLVWINCTEMPLRTEAVSLVLRRMNRNCELCDYGAVS